MRSRGLLEILENRFRNLSDHMHLRIDNLGYVIDDGCTENGRRFRWVELVSVFNPTNKIGGCLPESLVHAARNAACHEVLAVLHSRIIRRAALYQIRSEFDVHRGFKGI